MRKMDKSVFIINHRKGYTIIAADTRVQPILGESESGVLSLQSCDNPGVKVWMEDTADRILILKKENPIVKKDYSDLWQPFKEKTYIPVQTRIIDVDSIWIRVVETSSQTLYYHADQSALLTTKWGQKAPWNAKMPQDYITGGRCATGCAAVAVSQILRYFNKRGNYPTDLWHNIAIQSTTPVYNPFNYTWYLKTSLSKSNHKTNSSRWNSMPDTKLGSHTSYVSQLMLDIGNRINMFYSENDSFVTGDSLQYSIPNLSQCGISSRFAPFNFSLAASNIEMGWPVIVSAFTSPTLPREGHVWIIDGCKDYSRTYTTTETFYCIHPDTMSGYSNIVSVYSYDEMMSIYPEAYSGMQTVSSVEYTMRNLHMNWGWDGDGNGNYDMLIDDDWIYSQGTSSVNLLYSRSMHYHIQTSQLK